FSIKNIDISIPNRTLIKDFSLTIESNNFLVILGKNGAGKSLSLHTFAGLRSAESGEILLNNNNINNLKRRDIAKTLALLPQNSEDIFPASVFDSVLIGRHPHISPFNKETMEDIKISLDALDKVGLLDLKNSNINILSGGERRRLSIAQVIAQNAKIYLLDEPTNHLDPLHQLAILNLFKQMADNNYIVMATMHDVNLAAKYASHCLLLYGDGSWDFGIKEKILNEENLTRLYNIPMQKIEVDNKIFFTNG
ncbi:MAG: ABC transporter ATP-binding protein, partial [Woeseiaceae bacterium]|nr:ABC transporter ATP-binding protein [Woeseiaceae bacterium]